MAPLDPNAAVRHPRFGNGHVLLDQGESVVVRFEHGIEECLAADLELVDGLAERMAAGRLDSALPVVTRILGECIRSVNDAWGVFSRSRIDLLPHQLWVCKRVLESWPTRWLVADDVGLGKTIEAGLILTPLLSSGRVRRLLILAPASLVGQWQVRMREMFEIRIATYAAAADTPSSDFWNTQDKVIASAHTLRLDTAGRWERMLDAQPWDLVLIDEAHHMNVDEQGRRTLSYQLLDRLQERGKVQSMVLFTGTPHRGKDKGFLSLLRLLRPADFDPDQPLEDQIGKLRSVMIRNNKHSVTDMSGSPLFTPVRSTRETYTYSPQEARFYEQLTQFILTGKAYAAGLRFKDQRVVTLALITMQKLASSSVAAVRRALTRRLAGLRDAEARLEKSRQGLERLMELRVQDDPANLDEISRLEEQVVETLMGVRLNPDEIPALEELLAAASQVTSETKIARIITVIDDCFADRSVLFFTEYKATQALLMSALNKRYGDGCVTFINGDGYVEGVQDASGNVCRLTEDRRQAAARFNRGDVRFLVSTEAAGEGIDLQESCSALVHTDLPWNPMRLHQRVGRLSRYGQTKRVDVVTVRNPHTVESHIWDLLDEKLARIDLALRGAMDDPEDIRQLVIGMASPGMFTKVFSEADSASGRGQTLDDWFDAETATFGSAEAVDTVRDLVGNVARFDFGTVAGQIPRVDLPDLVPFVKAILTVRGRRPDQADDLRLSFRPPEEWKDDFLISTVDRYELLFAREPQPKEGEDVAGVGLRVVDRALQDAGELASAYAAVRGLDAPLFVFSVRDRITGSDGPIRAVVVAAQRGADGDWNLIRDWELVHRLNPLADKPRSIVFSDAEPALDASDLMLSAHEYVVSITDVLDLPFSLPTVESLACLVPASHGGTR
ncbi:MAG: type III restriction endonuclease subunit R [Acidimicrobiia bacterium]|nr:type III restriction endonuclease subunit R [Acidimicrobiia bacterium]